MELIIGLIAIWILIVLLNSLISFITKLFKHNNSFPARQENSSSNARNETDSNIYRPAKRTTKTANNKLIFRDVTDINRNSNDLDISDLVDAFTGSPLNLNEPLFQCCNCKVFYQIHSFEVITAENNGRCVSCLKTEIIRVIKKDAQRGQNADVNVITLKNYRQYVGRVITFEGYVFNVLVSRRGTDYAVMLENKSWTKGLKMVAFRRTIPEIGGEVFLRRLKGHSVKIRGLLTNHENYGYQIIISERGMILNIR